MRRYTLLLICLLFSGISYSQGWNLLATNGSITPRSNAAAVYDPLNHRMLVFGGFTSGGTVNDLWSLDLHTNSWSEIPNNSFQFPAARHTHICMFDSSANRILMWSGQGAALYNDVWAFNMTDSTWEELFPDGNVPGAPLKRYGVATSFDPINNNIITFAGFTTSGRFDDTWIFNIDSLAWEEKSNATFPIQRCLTSQSFAQDRREMIIYGGQSSGNLSDIWSLNVDTYSWTNLTPVQSPSARHFSSNVYCGNNNVVIFGGNSLNQGNNAGAMSDLWSYSLNTQTWDTVTQGTLKPSARFGHTYIYLPDQDKMIIFGGQGTSTLNAETWVYDGISSLLNNVEGVSSSITSFKCYPNPVLDDATFSFTLSEKSFNSILIYNGFGKMIAKIFEGELAPGEHRFNYSMKEMSPGFYFIILENNQSKESIKLIMHN